MYILVLYREPDNSLSADWADAVAAKATITSIEAKINLLHRIWITPLSLLSEFSANYVFPVIDTGFFK
jgi:hypothetical protein